MQYLRFIYMRKRPKVLDTPSFKEDHTKVSEHASECDQG